MALAGCGGGSPVGHTRAAAARPRGLVVIPRAVVRPGAVLREPLPAPAAVSFDLARQAGRPRHVEEVLHKATLIVQGPAEIRALIISSQDDRSALLLHRVAELHARLRPRQFPEGADVHDRLHIDSSGWMSGFWPGALWEAAAAVRGSARAMFTRWALRATTQHFGQERADSHDVGFTYGESSLRAWRARCSGRSSGRRGICAQLRRSVLSAADELRALAASNARAGTIPTNAHSPQADTIIDSVMNVAILPWASRMSGNGGYTQLARGHAHRVAALLVRRDGSTAQSVHFDRRSGRLLFVHTHQGLSNKSTWSRGQAWAVYGFAQAALELRDRDLLRVALRAARYVQRRLPRDGIPRWDYDAPVGAPVDVSAAVITAAGLGRLAQTCAILRPVCGPGFGEWRRLGKRLLAVSLTHARSTAPLGLLGSQVLNEHGRGCWCNGGELMFGVSYALQATRLLGTL